MLYFNRNGVWFKVPIAKGAVYDRDLLERQVHTSLLSLQNLKDRSPDLDQMRFEKPGEYVIKSVFGRDDILIYPPSLISGEEVVKKTDEIMMLIPAIEAYNSAGEFQGLIICNGGTFDPPYEFVGCDSDKLDEFLWGQWRNYYGSRPFTGDRNEKVFYVVEYAESKTTKILFDVPNTAELLADFNSIDTPDSYSATWEPSPPDVEVLCHLHADPLCTGDTCRAVRVETWRYSVNEGNGALDYFEIYNDDWDFTGEIVPGTESVYSYTGIGNNGFVKGPSLQHACATPGETPQPCSYCEALILDTVSLPFNSPASTYPTPSVTPSPLVNFIWDATITYNENDLIVPPVWYAWTNIESASEGGMNAVFESNTFTRKLDRNNGALVGPIDNVIIGWDASVRTYATSTVVETDVYSWKEGAVVNGIAYVVESGEGMYSDSDDQFYYDDMHPRYWNLGYYMSSARRETSNNRDYYFISTSNQQITQTTFQHSHILGGTYYHEIPGYPDLFGKGYFRLVRKYEVIEKETVIKSEI